MKNRVKPVMPMSIEEHDKEVMEAWNGGRVSESIIQLILDNLGPVLKQYLIDYKYIDFNSWDFSPSYLIFLFEINKTLFMKLKIFDNGNYQIEKHANNDTVYIYYETFCAAKEEMINFIKPYLPEELKTEDYACEFCADGTDDYGKSLFREELKLGNAAIADIDVYIGSEDNMEMLITNSTDEVIAKQVMKIKYCPMCGRKLGGTE